MSVSANSGIGYEILTESSQVTAICSEWNALVERSTCNRAFSSSVWFLSACDLTPGFRPQVVVARRYGKVAGILPLALSRDGMEAGFPGDLSDYNDIIASPDDIPVHTGLLAFAMSPARPYRRLVLKCVRTDSACRQAMHALSDEGITVEAREGAGIVCPFVDLTSGCQPYLETRTSGFRKRLRQIESKARRSNVVVRELTPGDFPADRVADEFLSLHLSRFGPRTGFRAAFVQTFLRRLLPALFAEGRMKVFALFNGSAMVAIHLCMVGANSLCLWGGGFLADAAHFSPGMLLIGAEIQSACALGYGEYDLMRGAENYKERWATHTRTIVEFEFATKGRL